MIWDHTLSFFVIVDNLLWCFIMFFHVSSLFFICFHFSSFFMFALCLFVPIWKMKRNDMGSFLISFYHFYDLFIMLDHCLHLSLCFFIFSFSHHIYLCHFEKWRKMIWDHFLYIYCFFLSFSIMFYHFLSFVYRFFIFLYFSFIWAFMPRPAPPGPAPARPARTKQAKMTYERKMKKMIKRSYENEEKWYYRTISLSCVFIFLYLFVFFFICLSFSFSCLHFFIFVHFSSFVWVSLWKKWSKASHA